MVNTRSTHHGSPQQGHGRDQLLGGNPTSYPVPPPTVQHQQAKGAGENDPNPVEIPNDPLITQLNAMQHSPARTVAPSPNESQAHSHVVPQPRQPSQPAVSDPPNQPHLEQVVPENRSPQIPVQPSSTPIPTPLNTNIIHEPYPPGFRMPQLETYDGTKDPNDHLHAFYSVMQAQNASDALMCKIFPSTLRGNAQTWYYSLLQSSIGSYAELAASFATKFSSCRLIKKTTSELMRVAQKEGESLKNYMNRFNDAVLEIGSFSQAVGLAALTQGLKHERDQLKFVQEQGRPQSSRDANNRLGVGYQQAPPPLPPPSRIIHMITGGLEAEGTSSKQQKLYMREVKHPNRAQKRKFDETDWKNQPITFSSTDFDGVVTAHNDPLVTSVMVNSCEVQRVLVDRGSAPDIMYYHCFESLGLDPALLQRYDGPIYGFNNHNNQPVPVEGILKLNVAFGSSRTYVTPSVRFLVVKMASSFNIVIGRPTLTEIRAVVSPSHLCLKFPTPTGVAMLRGNQEIARHCYMTSVSRPQRDKQVANLEPTQPEVPTTQQVMGVELLDNRPEGEARATPAEEVEEVQLDDNDPTKKTRIGTKLSSEDRHSSLAF
ncbi:hypothetical protein SLEP1_g37937 [Rubroshorea leprosula]|uniref:Retrotransposon gag domain-containing protein n=1 Tax=Rubroshorea leprosula TaxID=152421 RepID=A0AAV5KWN5_9ROSI|nr:hypothetical protein SLEP1_g37937 [Rubroshorea leprosula]